MAEFCARQTQTVDLPLQKLVDLLGIESIVIRVRNATTIDIGAACYLRRRLRSVLLGRRHTEVDADSFCKNRTTILRRTMRYASDLLRVGTLADTTIAAKIGNWLRFLAWCDDNDHSECCASVSNAHAALEEYSFWLVERLRKNDLRASTAQIYQYEAIHFCIDVIELPDADRGIPQIMRTSCGSATQPPDLDDQARLIALCNSLFDGICELVIDQRSFPHKIKMPDYLDWPKKELCLFPTTMWAMPHHVLADRENLYHPMWPYNFDEGRLSTVEEIESKYLNKTHASQAIWRAHRKLLGANSNPQHPRRRSLAVKAHNAFVVLFSAHTGMNWAQVESLLWSDSFSIGKSSQEFRVVKARARNREVSFRIGSNFVRRFRRFLQLRRFLLEGKGDSQHLFFSLGQNGIAKPHRIGFHLLTWTYATFIRIDPNISPIMTRQWRAAKSDWFVRKSDIATTALVLQTSEGSVKKSYLAGSIHTVTGELSTYFERVSEVVQTRGRELQHGFEEGALASCSKFGAPQPVDHPDIEPDCRSPEGCLFCANFKTHIDETDVRKLVSYRYCILKTAHLSNSASHFDSLFGAILGRLSTILEYMASTSARNARLVSRITREVEEGELLDPYWASKMQLLAELGVVSEHQA